MKTTVDVACYWCHAKNRVQIGTSVYAAKAFYSCYSCNKNAIITITQGSAEVIQSPNIQKGEPIDA